MKPGTIGLVPGSGFVMWCVRKITRSPYGHAVLYYGSGLVIEGEPGVRFRLWRWQFKWGSGARWGDVSSFPNIYWCRNLARGLTDEETAGICQWARDHLGTPYSFIDDAEIGFTDLFGWAPKWMRNRLRSDRTLMCSQLCVAAYKFAGRVLFPGKPDGAESPGDIWRLDQAAT